MNAKQFFALILQLKFYLVLKCNTNCNYEVEITNCSASSVYAEAGHKYGCKKAFDKDASSQWESSKKDKNPRMQLDFKDSLHLRSINLFQPENYKYRFRNIDIQFSDTSTLSYELKDNKGWDNVTLSNDTVSRYVIITGQSFYYTSKYSRKIPEITIVGCQPIDCDWSDRYGNWSECSGGCDNSTRTSSSRFIKKISRKNVCWKLYKN